MKKALVLFLCLLLLLAISLLTTAGVFSDGVDAWNGRDGAAIQKNASVFWKTEA